MSQISQSSTSAGHGTSNEFDTRIIGDFKIGAEIGRGSFANVYKGVNLTNHKPVAIKSIIKTKLKNKKLMENLEIEISILKDLKHPHIVELLDFKRTNTHFHLMMEYCSLGDLSFFIKKKNDLIKKHPLVKTMFNKYPSPSENHNGLNKILVLNYLKQLSSALQFLRSKNLVHRDIKPQNLLLSPPIFQQEKFDNEGFVGLNDLPILRIADFGFARFLPNTSLAETLCGSPLYMAPEILNYQKYNAKADLWSVGAVLYEMSVGKPPFKASNHLELFNKIKKSKDNINFPDYAEAYLDPQIKRLICSLLKFEPTERMGFNEFFQDEIVNYDLNSLNDDSVNKSINLEPSQVDENLFISEYIGKGAIINNNTGNDIPEVEIPDTINEERSFNQVKKTPTPSLPPAPQIKQISQRDIQPITQQAVSNLQRQPSQSSQGSSQQQQQQVSQQKPNFRFNNKGQSSDTYVEKEYVVVEKTAVEVNALADELANAGTGVGAIALPKNYYTQNRRRSSRTSSGGSNSGPSGRRPSFNDRRVSISISPTNALSKALGLASTRLFGNTAGSNYNNNSNNHTLSVLNNSNNSFTNNIILNSANPILNYNSYKVNLNNETNESSSSSNNITLQLESLATKAHVINLFAEVKFSQLIPSPPSSNSFAVEDEDDLTTNDEINNLPPDVIKNLADEAVLLYVKTLSLLAKAMNIASEWWHNSDNKPDQRLNEIVQWVRDRFNEVLEKAEFVKLKLFDANKKLIKQNDEQIDYFTSASTTNEDKIFAERLIYDRALEIAKNTAKSEMMGNDLLGCELAYSTSIWMLEALLDQDNDVEKLEDGDKEMVEKYIESISNRLNSLKKKLENQK
ncbi:Serine/threonine-protein kinase [Wickerhamomyces ciferrii]|uniref:Serine/threonine-protein kinase ATG1 n=1 Tax=Wickerhamomyces ciferrii (strain ATCC 14091 / BCRC 22168 / CBS 111 / JCM 3599 / NBRC 0793 / NRRL Y-1031 F-60-10) TaxID=1206466 RepID=K0KH46_WICCF|nr:Serine/threonine-protein kinase [Wickerhamomyces ciferrii]CCH44535.1 Serine/threonine-protein kinase [Wickerhamomyces ciferrii]